MNPEETLYLAVMEALSGGPLSHADLVASLKDSGALGEDVDEEELEDTLLDSDAVWSSSSNVYARADLMLEGAYFTHRLQGSEKTRDMVDIVPDLDALDLALEQIQLVDGQMLKVVFPRGVKTAASHGSFMGTHGWLDDFKENALIAFRREGSHISFSKCEGFSTGEREQAALLRSFSNLYRSGRGVEPMEIVLDALCEDPSLFRSAVPPISELLEANSLELRGAWLGPKNEEWDPPGKIWANQQRDKIAERYGFEKCCKEAFDLATNAWSSWVVNPTFDLDKAALLRALGHGTVTPGFASWAFGHGGSVEIMLEEFIGELLEVPGTLAAPLYLLRALAKANVGQANAAEQDLFEALRIDPNYDPARLELANYAADRGDLNACIGMLRRCDPRGVADQIDFLTGLLAKFPPTGRNDPCPCGSGRKYKSCCLSSPRLSTGNHKRWMMYKLTQFALRPGSEDDISSLFEFFDSEVETDSVGDFSSLILDLAVFEGGGVEDYLRLREELLDEIDIGLLNAYVNTKRSLLEVIEVVEGESLTLFDKVQNRTSHVKERQVSLNRAVGDFLLGRIVDTPEAEFIVGVSLVIEMRHRESLISLLREDPGPLDLLSWLASTLTQDSSETQESSKILS